MSAGAGVAGAADGGDASANKAKRDGNDVGDGLYDDFFSDDADGELDRDVIEKAMDAYDLSCSREDVECMMACLDSDRSGGISRSEFMSIARDIRLKAHGDANADDITEAERLAAADHISPGVLFAYCRSVLETSSRVVLLALQFSRLFADMAQKHQSFQVGSSHARFLFELLLLLASAFHC
jgi:hypothetical protein